jgi:hypothetical protein
MIRFTLIVLLFVGCSDSPELAKMRAAIEAGSDAVTAKQDESLTILKDNTAALQSLAGQIDTLEASLVKSEPQQLGGDPVALEPQEPAKESKSAPLSVVSAPAVSLHVTYADFHCPPCDALKAAVNRGEFAGFAIIESQPFPGLKSYPAIRFQDASGQWKVIYGFDGSTVGTLHRLTGTNQFVSQPRITNPIVSHSDLVSLHNQLHGGGQWTWPGDLATHLRESHGVQTGGQPVGAIFPVQRHSAIVSARTTFRPVSQGSRFVGRSRVAFRKSCPAGGCP